MKKSILAGAATLLALAATPAFAQTDNNEGAFDGVYVGGSFGGGFQPNDRGERILFDRTGTGQFGSTVVTAAGADAFSPGFCNGAATSTAPNSCFKDHDGIEYMGRIGADTHYGPIVVGVVGEFGKTEINDSVSAFSTTPASYTMTRDLRFNGGVRGRVGYAANTTLFYATGGVAYGRVRNRFFTSNTTNSFTTNGDHDAWGASAGGGVEQLIGNNFSIGLEYLYTTLHDRKNRVFVGQGTALATNPFILGGGGTTFARSQSDFNYHSFRLTAAFRF